MKWIGILIVGMLLTGCHANSDNLDNSSDLKSGGTMTGVVFFKTTMLNELKAFYVDQVGCELFLDEGDCMIFRKGNFMVGFCQRDEAETGGLISFTFKTRDEVDRHFEKVRDCATSSPAQHPQYPVYQFYGKDPEGRGVEFQSFTKDLDLRF